MNHSWALIRLLELLRAKACHHDARNLQFIVTAKLHLRLNVEKASGVSDGGHHPRGCKGKWEPKHGCGSDRCPGLALLNHAAPKETPGAHRATQQLDQMVALTGWFSMNCHKDKSL